LHDRLLRIVQSQNRSLEAVEVSKVLPNKTFFYREPIPYSGKPSFTEVARALETSRRHAWSEQAFLMLSNAELVFLDPDNGIAGTRMKPHSRKSAKYALAKK